MKSPMLTILGSKMGGWGLSLILSNSPSKTITGFRYKNYNCQTCTVSDYLGMYMEEIFWSFSFNCRMFEKTYWKLFFSRFLFFLSKKFGSTILTEIFLKKSYFRYIFFPSDSNSGTRLSLNILSQSIRI